MTLPWVVELAPGGQPLDPFTWAWEEITGHVRVRDGISIEYGRDDWSVAVTPTRCQLTLDNTAGRFSAHNPLGPWYGKLNRNTPLRVRWGGRSEVIAHTVSQTGSASQAAPSVNAPSANGLLLCCWANGFDDGTYTLPGSMTGGATTTTTNLLTVRAGWETVSAGATGTRTATFTGMSDDWLAMSLVLTGVEAPPVLQEEVSGKALGDLTLTTASGTQRGWWLVAVQVSPDSPKFFPDVTSPDPDDTWTLLLDSSVTIALRMRVWIRPVTQSGAQTVTFEGSPSSSEEHRRVFVVSGPGHVRFTGFVSELPPRWDKSGKDATAPITANGILRRLQQGASPRRSAIYRTISAGIRNQDLTQIPVGTPQVMLPQQYWPFEDGSSATRGASGVSRGKPMVPTAGEVRFGQDGGPAGSASQVTIGQDASMSGQVQYFVPNLAAAAEPQWMFEAWFDLGPGTSPVPSVHADIVLNATQLSPYNRLAVRLAGNVFDLAGFDDAGTTFGLSTFIPSGPLTGVHHVAVTASQGGSNTTYRLYLDGAQVDSDVYLVDNATVRSIVVRNSTSGDVSIGVSHVAVWDFGTFLADVIADHADAGRSYAGETAGERIQRICRDEGVPFAASAALPDSMPMGPEPDGPFLDAIRDAEATDIGVLYEHGAGLTYRPRTARYNQTVKLALDVDAGHVAEPPEPTDDDQQLRNAITASQPSGSSAVFVDQESVDAVGIYDGSVTVNPATEEKLADIAAWLVHLGTVDELRWPRISLDLASNTSLRDAWLAFRLGNRLTVDHALPELPGVVIDLLVEGWTEHLTPFTWDVELNCVPASLWTVGVLDDNVLGRLDTDGSELAAQFVAGTNTSMSVSVTDGPLWTTTAAEFPLDVKVSGVVLQVTNITGASSPQTFTVQQAPVNGVAKTIPAGSDVRLAQPFILAL